RPAMRARRSGSANPNAETAGVNCLWAGVQAAAARRLATRLQIRSARSRAAMLGETRSCGLVELSEQGQVIGRNGGERDEGPEQEHVGDRNARERRRARAPERQALQVAPGPGCERGEAVEAGDVPEDEGSEQRLWNEQAPCRTRGLRLRRDRAHHPGDQGCRRRRRAERLHAEGQGYRLLMLSAAVRTGDQVVADGSCPLGIGLLEVAVDVRLQEDAHARAREGSHDWAASSDSASEWRSRARARWRRDLMAGTVRLRLWATCSRGRSA